MGLKSGADDKMAPQLFADVSIIEETTIKAHTEVLLSVKSSFDIDGNVLVNPLRQKLANKGLVSPSCISKADKSVMLMSIAKHSQRTTNKILCDLMRDQS